MECQEGRQMSEQDYNTMPGITATSLKAGRLSMAHMALRDWFAGQALNGVLLAGGEPGQTAQSNPFKAANWAYQYADAMLVERAKGQSE